MKAIDGSPRWNRDALFGLVLLAATLTAYSPAWNGKPVWDDNGHITAIDLRTGHGLARIWTEPGATQQYYPLVHTVFWVACHLWGDSTPGYHFLNILLHVISALLLMLILRRLNVPGQAAWLAAGIFALHPVQTESVAWMTELKNTLSGVFFFGAALAYLRFDCERRRKWQVIAFLLFLSGLLSKSVIATLPVSLLALFWWKRGTLRWKQDAVPLLPFFAVAAASGLFTVWMERRFVGARGSEFDFTFVERCLIAGRAVWFYLDKLFFPAHLTFIYPRWQVSRFAAWQYCYPAAALALAAALWALRKRRRGPLAALLCFAATLFPVMGFFNVYPFRFSFVADHFQYLAMTAPVALAATGLTLGLGHLQGATGRFARPVLYGALLALLGALTWKQSGMYADAGTLYRTTILKNPACWMAYNNLGLLLTDKGRPDEAMELYRKALELKPDYFEAWNNLGIVLRKSGRSDEAMAMYQRALDINPSFVEAHFNLGNALQEAGRLDEAIFHYRKALDIKPEDITALNNLAGALMRKGELTGAIECLRKALALAKAEGPNRESMARGIAANLERLYAAGGARPDSGAHR